MTTQQYQQSYPIPVQAIARPVAPAALEALSNALNSERKLIEELVAVVLNQRAAIGVDDLQAVDDSVFATHRLLLTLGEARKRRRSINSIMGVDEATGVKQLSDALGSWMTPKLHTERDELQEAARRLSREIEINRRLLREALANSESFVRAMRGAPAEASESGYGAASPMPYGRTDPTAFSRMA